MNSHRYTKDIDKQIVEKLISYYNNSDKPTPDVWKRIALELSEDPEHENRDYRWQDLRSYFQSSLVYRLSQYRHGDDETTVIDRLQFPYLAKIYSIKISFISREAVVQDNNRRKNELEENELLIKYSIDGKFDPQIVGVFKRLRQQRTRVCIDINVEDPRYNLSEGVKKLLLELNPSNRRNRKKAPATNPPGTWQACGGAPVVGNQVSPLMLDGIAVHINNNSQESAFVSPRTLLERQSFTISTQEYDRIIKQSLERDVPVASPPRRVCDPVLAQNQSQSYSEMNVIEEVYVDQNRTLSQTFAMGVSLDPLQISSMATDALSGASDTESSELPPLPKRVRDQSQSGLKIYDTDEVYLDQDEILNRSTAWSVSNYLLHFTSTHTDASPGATSDRDGNGNSELVIAFSESTLPTSASLPQLPTLRSQPPTLLTEETERNSSVQTGAVSSRESIEKALEQPKDVTICGEDLLETGQNVEIEEDSEVDSESVRIPETREANQPPTNEGCSANASTPVPPPVVLSSASSEKEHSVDTTQETGSTELVPSNVGTGPPISTDTNHNLRWDIFSDYENSPTASERSSKDELSDNVEMNEAPQVSRKCHIEPSPVSVNEQSNCPEIIDTSKEGGSANSEPLFTPSSGEVTKDKEPAQVIMLGNRPLILVTTVEQLPQVFNNSGLATFTEFAAYEKQNQFRNVVNYINRCEDSSENLRNFRIETPFNPPAAEYSQPVSASKSVQNLTAVRQSLVIASPPPIVQPEVPSTGSNETTSTDLSENDPQWDIFSDRENSSTSPQDTSTSRKDTEVFQDFFSDDETDSTEHDVPSVKQEDTSSTVPLAEFAANKNQTQAIRSASFATSETDYDRQVVANHFQTSQTVTASTTCHEKETRTSECNNNIDHRPWLIAKAKSAPTITNRTLLEAHDKAHVNKTTELSNLRQGPFWDIFSDSEDGSETAPPQQPRVAIEQSLSAAENSMEQERSTDPIEATTKVTGQGNTVQIESSRSPADLRSDRNRNQTVPGCIEAPEQHPPDSDKNLNQPSNQSHSPVIQHSGAMEAPTSAAGISVLLPSGSDTRNHSDSPQKLLQENQASNEQQSLWDIFSDDEAEASTSSKGENNQAETIGPHISIDSPKVTNRSPPKGAQAHLFMEFVFDDEDNSVQHEDSTTAAPLIERAIEELNQAARTLAAREAESNQQLLNNSRTPVALHVEIDVVCNGKRASPKKLPTISREKSFRDKNTPLNGLVSTKTVSAKTSKSTKNVSARKQKPSEQTETEMPPPLDQRVSVVQIQSTSDRSAVNELHTITGQPSEPPAAVQTKQRSLWDIFSSDEEELEHRSIDDVDQIENIRPASANISSDSLSLSNASNRHLLWQDVFSDGRETLDRSVQLVKVEDSSSTVPLSASFGDAGPRRRTVAKRKNGIIPPLSSDTEINEPTPHPLPKRRRRVLRVRS
ncbi:uncharacterized protein LOC128736809 [Sabethes cyaneus]|uniref:uncharacterized protein LOC128736809 n=1 Tax=Sabethes cyaneus TaxID=53552 RepID=UPI00237D6A54|nr:uncharacterized protein LOC128736809 [Sabethes cyaneus]